MYDITMGWLPAWIIGGPLLFAIFDWMRTPKPSRDRATDERRDAVRMHQMATAQR